MMPRAKQMAQIAIVTDSSACLPPELIQQYRIAVVPLALLFDGDVYRDGDLSNEEFYERLRDPYLRPTTAAPAPGEFLTALRRARDDGASAALCLTLSSRYSGAHSSAVSAEQLAARELPGFTVRVVDTEGIAMAHGFAVLAAARSAAAGSALEEVTATAERAGLDASLVGVLDSTRYLARSGRVPWVLHFVASILRIKPIIAASGGKIGAVGRVRTMAGGIERMVDYVGRKMAAGTPLRIAVMHADAPAWAAELARRVREELAPQELLITPFTSVMAVHTGPGFVGIAWQAVEPALEAVSMSDASEGAVQRATTARPRRSSLLARDVRILEASLGPLPQPVERPPLIVLSGLPGSGKSYLARDIERRYPLALLESDALRKALVKRPVYSQKESGRLFAACHALLEDLLGKGIPALLDATNLKEMHRRPLYSIAERAGARLVLVEVRAADEVARRRLEARLKAENPWDRSDASLDVYESMRREAEPIDRPHVVMDGSGDTGLGAERVLRQLEEADVCG